MKYDINKKGFETRDVDVEFDQIMIDIIKDGKEIIPVEYDIDGKLIKGAILEDYYRMRYRFKVIKAGEIVPYPFNMNMIYCEWDKQTNPFEFALNHFKEREEVTSL